MPTFITHHLKDLKHGNEWFAKGIFKSVFYGPGVFFLVARNI